jgi:hypothetical protein
VWYDEYAVEELPEPVKMWLESPEGSEFMKNFYLMAFDEGIENGIHFWDIESDKVEENDE